MEESPADTYEPAGVRISVYPRTGTNLLLISPVNVGRESFFDASSGAVLQTIVFNGKKAQLYQCPAQNKCAPPVSYYKAIHLLQFPSGWTSDNEIDYYESGENQTTTAEVILDSFRFTE